MYIYIYTYIYIYSIQSMYSCILSCKLKSAPVGSPDCPGCRLLSCSLKQKFARRMDMEVVGK